MRILSSRFGACTEGLCSPSRSVSSSSSIPAQDGALRSPWTFQSKTRPASSRSFAPSPFITGCSPSLGGVDWRPEVGDIAELLKVHPRDVGPRHAPAEFVGPVFDLQQLPAVVQERCHRSRDGVGILEGNDD